MIPAGAENRPHTEHPRMGDARVRWMHQILTALVQPFLLFGAVGVGFRTLFQTAGDGVYMQFLTPAILATTISFVAVLGAIWRKSTLRSELRGVTTLRSGLMRMFGIVTTTAALAVGCGFLVMGFCICAGFRVDRPIVLIRAFSLTIPVSLSFALLGLAIALKSRSAANRRFAASQIPMSMLLLSGAFYPPSDTPLPLTIIARLDPMAYAIDCLRGGLFYSPHLRSDLVFLSFLGAISLGVSIYCFGERSALTKHE